MGGRRGVVADQDDEGGRDHELVGEGVEQHAHGGDLVAAAGEVAVEAVGDAGEDEDDGGDDLLLAAAEAGGAVPGKGKTGERIQMSRGTLAMRLIVMELGRFMARSAATVRRGQGTRGRH